MSLIGLENFCLSPQVSSGVSSSSPRSVVFSDNGKDGFCLNQEHFDFKLTSELTRLDLASALEWLESLESSQQMRSLSPKLSSKNVSLQEPLNDMMTDRNTNGDSFISAATKHDLLPQPEVVTGSGSNFPHCVPQQNARNPVSVYCVPQYTGYSDKEWKRERYAVPDDCKDERYWRKRCKNNISAKKSREAKRAKDLLVARKIEELEKENAALKMMLRNLMLQQPQQIQQNNNGICFCGNKLI